jgi:hypothetical protein
VLAGIEVHAPTAYNPVTSRSTDPSGVWAVDGLVPGDYSVAFGTPSGTVLTAPDKGSDDTLDSDPAAEGSTVDVTLTSGSSRDDIGAGYFTPGRVGGTVWTDLDGDGVRDAGEPGTPDVTVRLTGTDGAGNPVSIEVTTGAAAPTPSMTWWQLVTVVARLRPHGPERRCRRRRLDIDQSPPRLRRLWLVHGGQRLVGGATLGGQA